MIYTDFKTVPQDVKDRLMFAIKNGFIAAKVAPETSNPYFEFEGYNFDINAMQDVPRNV